MFRSLGLGVIGLIFVSSASAELDLSKATIYTQPGATTSDTWAAQNLRTHLSKMAGKEIALQTNVRSTTGVSILVGQGPLSERLFPEVKWAELGKEEVLLKTKGNVLLVAGGKPRGTVYASSRFLHRLGVRWWTPWADTVPNKKPIIGDLDVRESPALEYRDNYWFHAFNADWAARNYNNGFNTKIDEARGGRVEYQGFVHTFYDFAPPAKYFATKPEWYSELNGVRTYQHAQLCTTNPELREHILTQLKAQLRANPRAKIASISQNDWYNPCTCKACKEQADAEGSQSALVLDLANYVAERIEKEFPDVAIDTLAYQWSRKPPLKMKPRPNVIVRLCSIECNFAYPLDAPQNASFGNDIRGWSKLTNRLYIWNYTTDFAHYIQPQPDYFNLGPTLKFFLNHGAKGVFEQGAYQSTGGEMGELKAWVMGQLMWDPSQDDQALIDEFLKGYYGDAAPAVKGYLDWMAKEAKAWNLTFASSTSASFLRYESMKAATRWLERAFSLAGPDEDLQWRLRQAYLPVLYVWLNRWSEFRRESRLSADNWALLSSRKEVADKWLQLATQPGPAGWTPITHVHEGGLTPQAFVARFENDPEEPDLRPLPARKKNPAAPKGLPIGIDAQDDLASLFQAPDRSQLRADALASDGIACWMPGDHHEWAFQIPLDQLPSLHQGTWRVYAVVRVDSSVVDVSTAFSAGIYDASTGKELTKNIFRLDQAGKDYRAFDIGVVKTNPSMKIWVAPPANSKVRSVWVDRIYFVKE